MLEPLAFDINSLLASVGILGVIGFVAGWLAKKAVKGLILLGVLFAIGLGYLSSQGVITVSWTNFYNWLQSLSGSPAVTTIWTTITQTVAQIIPLLGGFGVGFLLGFLKG